MIDEIGGMIVEDERFQAVPWQAIAIAVTLADGQREMSTYRYLEDGSFQAGSPKAAGAILRKIRALKAQMEADGDGAFQQCLIQITKPDYKLRLQFEFDNPKRWWPGDLGMDMSGFAESLRPA